MNDAIIAALTSEPQSAAQIAAKVGKTVKTVRKYLKPLREANTIGYSKVSGKLVYVGVTMTPCIKRTKTELVNVVTARQAKHKRRLDAATTVWDRQKHRTRYQRASKRLEGLK